MPCGFKQLYSDKPVIHFRRQSEVVQPGIELIVGQHKVIEQIADKLAVEGLVNKERFLQLAKEGSFDLRVGNSSLSVLER